jgi:hypothetical protein
MNTKDIEMSNTTIPSVIPSPLQTYAETVVGGQVRHFLTGTGGGLIITGIFNNGGLDTESAVKIVSGITLYAAGAAWSWWQKSGPAFVAAQLARLKGHVAAIPVITSPSLTQATGIASAVEAAKIVAELPASAPVFKPTAASPISQKLG